MGNIYHVRFINRDFNFAATRGKIKFSFLEQDIVIAANGPLKGHAGCTGPGVTIQPTVSPKLYMPLAWYGAKVSCGVIGARCLKQEPIVIGRIKNGRVRIWITRRPSPATGHHSLIEIRVAVGALGKRTVASHFGCQALSCSSSSSDLLCSQGGGFLGIGFVSQTTHLVFSARFARAGFVSSDFGGGAVGLAGVGYEFGFVPLNGLREWFCL